MTPPVARTTPRAWLRTALPAAFALSTACLACDRGTGPATPPGACEQSGEFANFGCAEVTGRVVGSAGAPIAGASVGPAAVPGGGTFNTPYVETDLQGHFRFRFARFDPPPVDTFSAYVRAALPAPPNTGATGPLAVDSVLVPLRLSPVGTRPTASEVEIRLAFP